MNNPLEHSDIVLKHEGEFYSVICNTTAGKQFAAKNRHVKITKHTLHVLHRDYSSLCEDAESANITVFEF